MDNASASRLYKIAFLFGVILFGFAIFLVSIISTANSDRDVLDVTNFKKEKAVRGSIISADGYHLAFSSKLYKVAINTNTLNPDKKELFIKLFSIYSGENESKIRALIGAKKGYVILTDDIDSKRANHLKSLAFELTKMNVFIPYESEKLKKTIYLGLDVFESGEKRKFNYNDTLSPYLGYVRKNIKEDSVTTVGIKGIEGFYNKYLNNKRDGLILGKKDINKNIIISNETLAFSKLDGITLNLSVDMLLQKKLESILDDAKLTYNAKEVLAAIMDSTTGEIVAIGTSNRYDPNNIRKNNIGYLNVSAVENQYEPGSVIKPIIYALLVEKNLIKSTDIINGYNGVYMIGKKTITDTHKMASMSAEEILIHSSNIGMAQIIQRLSSVEIDNGLKNFGFMQKTGIDLSQEKKGYIVPVSKLESPIYKASISYGYGMQATFVQILNAYNVFNNAGQLTNIRLVKSAKYQDGYYYEAKTIPYSVVSPLTAKKVQNILVKIVKEGTGKDADIAGLEIGGKTGTAHIAKNGQYVNEYISSFFGFANDSKSKYTIGVTMFEPQNGYFAAQTSVPVFKSIVGSLIEKKMLKPAVIGNQTATQISP